MMESMSTEVTENPASSMTCLVTGNPAERMTRSSEYPIVLAAYVSEFGTHSSSSASGPSWDSIKCPSAAMIVPSLGDDITVVRCSVDPGTSISSTW